MLNKIKYIFVLYALFISFSGFSQRIVSNTHILFKDKEYNLSEILSLLENQSGIKINYSPSQVNLLKLKLSKKEFSVMELLEIIKDRFNIDYFIEKDNVYLLKNYSNNVSEKSISGYVKDKESGEVLIGAFISLVSSNVSATTDEKGYFNIALKNPFDTLKISYVGYNTLKLCIQNIQKSLNTSFELDRAGVLDEVIIKDDYKNNLSLNQMTFQSSLYDIENMVSVLGTGDLINEISFLPGMDKLNDLQGGISINGFAPSSNYYYLDGVRIYEPNHIFGLFSAFNSNPVNRVSIYTNNIPGWYSGALTGVIDSHLKEGNVVENTGSVSLGLSNVNVFFSGPIIKYKTSIVFDCRKSLLDYYIPGILNKHVEFNLKKLDFYDLNFKITHKISASNKINFIIYKGWDNIKINNSINNKLVANNNFNWYNQALALKWDMLYRDDLNSEIKVSMSNYENNSSTVFELPIGNNEKHFLSILSKNKLRDITLSHRLKYYSSITTYNFGYSIAKYNISPLVKSKISDNVISAEVETPEDSVFYFSSAFLDLDINKFNNILISGKTVFNFLHSNGYTDFYITPGINLIAKTAKRSFLQIGYNTSSEFLHSLGNYTVGIPSMLWVGENEKVPACKMHDFSILYKIGIKNFDMKTRVYYKIIKDKVRYKNLTDVYNPFSSKGVIIPVFNNSQSFDDLVNIGDGKAFGMNFLLEYSKKNLDVKFSSSTNRVFYHFEDLNHGDYFQGKYNMLFSFSWFLKYNYKGFKLSATYKFHSGGVFTLPENVFHSDSGAEILDYSKLNNNTFKDFHSMSLGLSKSINLNNISVSMDLGCTNVFNHFNPTYAYIYKYLDYYKVNEISGFPILPYLKIKAYFY